MTKPTPASSDQYRHFLRIATRWMDNIAPRAECA
jgi:hypothetical protein